MSAFVRRITGQVGVVSVLALAGCSGGPLDPHGPVAGAERTILFDALAIMLAIVIPTIVGAAWVAWWFRASNRKALYEPDFAYSGRIEILVWSIPTLIILFLGGVIWISSHQLDPAVPLESDTRATEIEVVSLDWKWLFIYPDRGVASINELVIPAGAPVHFQLTSASVMNTFFVPQLAGMIYTMNGMVTQLNFAASHPGEFWGRSGMFSGDGFPDMYFKVRAVPPEEYERWITAAQTAGPTLDRPAYEELEAQNIAERPYTYRNVDPALFHAITTQVVPPQPGPVAGRAGVDVHPKSGRE
jgi:cytochrome o ubiquinol oxidase subunit 2